MEFSGQNSYAANKPSNFAQSQQTESTSKIRDSITATEQLLTAVHEEITQLEKRLDTVLRPVPPQGESRMNAPTPAPVCSHVTGRLAILNEGFQGAIQRLRDITSRTEV